jgi:hypothetical protein
VLVVHDVLLTCFYLQGWGQNKRAAQGRPHRFMESLRP